MIIDLLSPFWGSLIIGILLMIILGTYHYVRTLVTLNVTNKQLSNVLSELYSLQKNHKEEITDIKKRNKEEMEKIQNSKKDFLEMEKEVIEKAKRLIVDISKGFKVKEKEIGQGILKGLEDLRDVQKENNTLIECPICKKGNLRSR